MTTRRQHYVFRHYLEGWCDSDEKLKFLRDGKIISSKPASILLERDFYRIQEITPNDLRYFTYFVVNPTEPQTWKDGHKRFAEQLAFIAKASEFLQRHPGVPEQDKNAARAAVIQTLEDIHSEIEQNAVPLLHNMKRNDFSFLSRKHDAINFFSYISHQIFRTRQARDRLVDAFSEFIPRESALRLQGVICHCFADNVGGSLYVSRSDYSPILLESHGHCHFITSDQPAFNLLGAETGKEIEHLAIYYPLDARKALIFAPTALGLSSLAGSLNDDEVDQLNDAVASHAHQILVARDRTVLEKYQDRDHWGERKTPRFIQDHL